MKKILILLLTCFLMLASCKNSESVSEPDEKVSSEEYATAISSLTAYDISADAELIPYRKGGLCCSISSKKHMHTLEQWNEKYPLEHIQSIDDQTVIAVYKIFTEDMEQPVYMYHLFELVYVEKNQEDFKISENLSKYHSTHEYYYLSKKLSSADFEIVKKGVYKETVLEIEPAVAWDEGTSYRLLEDGVMIISFEETPDGRWIVSDKDFYSYDMYYSTNIKVLDIDNIILP